MENEIDIDINNLSINYIIFNILNEYIKKFNEGDIIYNSYINIITYHNFQCKQLRKKIKNNYNNSKYNKDLSRHIENNKNNSHLRDINKFLIAIINENF